MKGVSFENTEIAFESKSDRELWKAYQLFRLIGNPFLVKVGSYLVRIALFFHIPIGWAIRRNVFAHFCGGETIEECARATMVLDRFHIGTILDYSVEGRDAEADLDATCAEILRTIRTARGNPHIPFCVFKVTGLARFSLLEKVSSGVLLSTEELNEWSGVRSRVSSICTLAGETGTPVFIDAEDSWIQDAIDGLVEEMMATHNREACIVFHTLQMYRHDRYEYLRLIHKRAQEGGYLIGIKLVRGAYMEKERNRAQSLGYVDPIQPDKNACDRDFNEALRYAIRHLNEIAVCCGSHNEESSLVLVELMRSAGIDPSDRRVFFAQLFGMSDHISFNLANAGYNVAKYVPYGPIREVIPYLIRRAEENTSVEGQAGRELTLIRKELSRRKALSVAGKPAGP